MNSISRSILARSVGGNGAVGGVSGLISATGGDGGARDRAIAGMMGQSTGERSENARLQQLYISCLDIAFTCL